MIRLIDKGGSWRVETETIGLSVYLDNHSIIDLATRRPDLRARFLAALHAGGTLLFSVTNVIEITGPQGRSSDAVRRLLEDVGSRWVPVDLDPNAVIKREEEGHPAPPISEGFMRAFVDQRMGELEMAGLSIYPGDPAFFDLGKLVDWTREHRTEIRKDAAGMDDTVIAKITEFRSLYDQGVRSIDSNADAPLLPGRPAAYVFDQLARMMLQEAKSHRFQPHDALDLCHAVIAIAYGSVVTLDKKWWRRANSMKHRDKMARVYYAAQLEEFVATLESAAQAPPKKDSA